MSLLHHWFLPHHTNNQRARLLHPSAFLFVIGLVVSIQIIIGQVTRYRPDILGFASQIAPSEIVRLTNIERLNRGLPALTLVGQLNEAAVGKAADMFARDYWAHVSPVGTEPWYFITQAGYSYRYAGENLARDFSDPASIVSAWMNSPTHRDNLLSNRYQDIGIAVVDGTLSGRETTLVVQMFGTRLETASRVGAAAFAVSAQAPSPTVLPSPVPQYAVALDTTSSALIAKAAPVSSRLDPFRLNRVLSFAFLGLFLIVFLADIALVNHRQIYRWTSKSLAHFIFLAAILVAAATIIRGQIM